MVAVPTFNPYYEVLVDGTQVPLSSFSYNIQSGPGFSSAATTLTGYPGVTFNSHRVVLAGNVIVSFDTTQNSTPTDHNFTLRWQMDAVVTGLEAAAYTDFTIGGAFADATFEGSGPITYVLPPESDALDLSIYSNDPWAVSALGASARSTDVLAIGFNHYDGQFDGFIKYGNTAWRVTTNIDGSTDVESYSVTSGTVIRSGTQGVDNLRYGGTHDWISAKDGDDIISSGRGNDYVLGGSGNDEIRGGEGNDRIYGDSGLDTLRGDAGGDYIYGGADEDIIYGGADGDVLYGGDGSDRILGDNNNTDVSGSGDYIAGGAGDDIIYGFVGADTIDGGAGHDRLYGGSGGDTFAFTAETMGFRDKIYDFSYSEGDTIALADLLFGYDPVSSSIADFVRITESTGGNTYFAVDRDGMSSAHNFQTVATLYAVNDLDTHALDEFVFVYNTQA